MNPLKKLVEERNKEFIKKVDVLAQIPVFSDGGVLMSTDNILSQIKSFHAETITALLREMNKEKAALAMDIETLKSVIEGQKQLVPFLSQCAKEEVVKDLLEMCTHWGNGVKMVDEDSLKEYAKSHGISLPELK